MWKKVRGCASVVTATGIQKQVVWQHNPTSYRLYTIWLEHLVDNKNASANKKMGRGGAMLEVNRIDFAGQKLRNAQTFKQCDRIVMSVP